MCSTIKLHFFILLLWPQAITIAAARGAGVVPPTWKWGTPLSQAPLSVTPGHPLALRAGATGIAPAVGRRPRGVVARVGASISNQIHARTSADVVTAFAAAVVAFAAIKQRPRPEHEQSTVEEGSLIASNSSLRTMDPQSSLPAVPNSTIADVSVPRWHAMEPEQCIRFFGSSSIAGLSSALAAKRLASEGPNELSTADPASLWQSVREQFDNRLVQILLAVAVFSAAASLFEDEAHAFIEPAVIMIILLLNAIVGVWQSHSAEGALNALRELQPSFAAALRDGEWVPKLPSATLVPGDVVVLRAGDKVPADARLLDFLSSSFSVDEGSLTGESTTVSKSLESVDAAVPIQGKVNMVFSGTMVTAGSAYAVVTSTGMRTEIGKIQEGVEAAKADEEKTPLGQKLDEFGAQLSAIIGSVCVAVWLINFPRFFAPVFPNPIKGCVHYAKVAVALGVAAIPEGLPAIITLCLSLGTRRMAERNVIVRKLPSVETLGCTTVICTDKTGTLTANQMTATALVHVVVAGTEEARAASKALEADRGDWGSSDGYVSVEAMLDLPESRESSNSGRKAEASLRGPLLVEHTVGGFGYSPRGAVAGLSGKLASSACLKDLIEVAVLCNDASLLLKEGEFQRTGEPTEAALLALAEKLGQVVPGAALNSALSKAGELSQEVCRRTAESLKSRLQRIATLDFNRDRKSMSVVVRPRGKQVRSGRFRFHRRTRL